MKQRIVTGLFTIMTALSPVVFAQTPSSPTPPPPASTGKDQHSNKGGQLRGLDRADQMAGEHGRQGRETARDAQLNRPDRSDRSGRPDRPVRPDRPGR